MNNPGLSDEQKHDIEGFLSGAAAKRGGAGPGPGSSAFAPAGEPVAPVDTHRVTRDRSDARDRLMPAAAQTQPRLRLPVTCRVMLAPATDAGAVDGAAGGSLAIRPKNCPEIVAAIIARLGARAEDEVSCPDGTQRPLFAALSEACDIGRPSEAAIEVLASRAPDYDELLRLQAIAEGYPGAQPEGADLLGLLMAFPSAQPPAQELVAALAVLPPRHHSIADLPKAGAGAVPCRDGLLAPLDRVFSRDQSERADGRQRRRERAGELWARLQEGAHLFVCGAAQMARDVDTALAAIAARQGAMGAGAAKSWLGALVRGGRDRKDLY